MDKSLFQQIIDEEDGHNQHGNESSGSNRISEFMTQHYHHPQQQPLHMMNPAAAAAMMLPPSWYPQITQNNIPVHHNNANSSLHQHHHSQLYHRHHPQTSTVNLGSHSFQSIGPSSHLISNQFQYSPTNVSRENDVKCSIESTSTSNSNPEFPRQLVKFNKDNEVSRSGMTTEKDFNKETEISEEEPTVSDSTKETSQTELKEKKKDVNKPCFICQCNVSINKDSWRSIQRDFTSTNFVKLLSVIKQIMGTEHKEINLIKTNIVCMNCFVLLDRVDELQELLKVIFLHISYVIYTIYLFILLNIEYNMYTI